jgi:putative membrane protein
MKKVYLTATLALAIFTSCSRDDNDSNPGNMTNSQDMTFVMQASVSNTAEIQAGQLAATKGTNPSVRSFGQFMVTEHTTAQNDLKNVGTAIGVAVKDSVDPMHVALMQRLNTLSGRTFDTAYMNAQVLDHQNTINLFNTELTSGNRTEVKNYASTYLPHIQMHYTMADSIRRKL